MVGAAKRRPLGGRLLRRWTLGFVIVSGVAIGPTQGQTTATVNAGAGTSTTAVDTGAAGTTTTGVAGVVASSSSTASAAATGAGAAANGTAATASAASVGSSSSSSSSSGQTTLSGGGTPLGSGAVTTAPVTRFGAVAHLIWDQAVVVFVGGLGGTWNSNQALTADASIVALSLHTGFTAGVGGGTWLSVPTASLVDVPSSATDPRFTSYAASAIARSVDANVAGSNVDLLFYTFGNSANPTSSAVYVYDPSAPSNFYSFDDHVTSASPRIRTASCLLDSRTMLIHGGENGPDNSPSTITLQDTYLLDLVNATTSNNAWTSKTSSVASDPFLHDHVMECVDGVAYMLSGITADLNSDGTFIAADMTSVYVYTYNTDITAGSWAKRSTLADPANGYPPPRRSATLTALSSTSNILLLHAGVQVDLTYTYKDLWQLETDTLQWKQLASSPYLRHSHNAFIVNNYLVAAFGVVSNYSDPNPPVPGIVAYDISNNVWGNLPDGITAQTPPALPEHVSTSNTHTNTTVPVSNSQPILSSGAIAGIVVGAIAVILIISAIIIFRRRRTARTERLELEQKMNERLRREDMDRELALQGILGATAQTPMGRQVGGELARVIKHNQTGVRSAEASTDDDDSLTSEADESHVFKFGIKEVLKDERKPQKHLSPPGNRHSYVSGASGVSYPSGSGVTEGSSTSTDDDDDDDEDDDQTAASRPNSQVTTSPQLAAEKSDSTSVKKIRASIIDVVSKRSGSRNANFPKDEPLRPWELPGMGTLKSPSIRGSVVGNAASISGAAGGNGGRSSRNSHLERAFLSPDQRSFSPAFSDMHKTGSRYSMNSSVQSGASGSAVGEQFDESQYMRSLFAQFTDAQILESWNSYVVYTGQVYTLEQIVALRTIYGKDAV
ncbi:hypothetical protein HK100_001872 [Physocladia obscura]|uniref:Galactose oxidase n=1 Tax=Physocladia obscura TaxID=109957 RepID=A0AAD5XAQ8_9FUNG|nr:hypothetical protein HK100_001872 [Physocladia obscura]